jgi:hypothetical protein
MWIRFSVHTMARLASELDGKFTNDPIYFQEIRAQILEHVAEAADDPRYPKKSCPLYP